LTFSVPIDQPVISLLMETTKLELAISNITVNHNCVYVSCGICTNLMNEDSDSEFR